MLKRIKRAVKTTPPALSYDFAERVIELEMRIDTENSVSALKALLELYSVTII